MADQTAGPATTPTRPTDDLVLPFRTVNSRAQGRLVRLGASVDTILVRHGYPDSVSETLGEAIALSAMLGSLLKANGKLILQTKTDGPIKLIAVNVMSPGGLRGLASFDKDRVLALEAQGKPGQGVLLGSGHLAMTIDPGGDEVRYQGIVGLARHTLTQAAHAYFRQSEQIPTFVRLAIARHYAGARAGADRGWHWRAGGLLLQRLPSDAAKSQGPEDDTDEQVEEPGLLGEESEDWQRVRLLASTLEDHELLDPTLSPEQLLYRLFHEEGVTASPPSIVSERCGCSRERVEGLLKSFGAAELQDMREPDGSVTVSCEYCTTAYRFSPEEVATL